MNLTDDTLSAFLDGELPEADMQTIRHQLVTDPALGERLADLAAVDRTLADHYGAIDQRPLPAAVSDLLQTGAANQAKVVAFPTWRRARQGLQRRAGTAVAAALVLGFGLAQVWNSTELKTSSGWNQVAQALESTPSGETRTLATGEQLTPQLTFTNKAGEYCRHFRIEGPDSGSDNIACRIGDQSTNWSRVAMAKTPNEGSNGRYQTVAGGSALDGVLDRMMSGDVMDISQEARLLAEGWRTD